MSKRFKGRGGQATGFNKFVPFRKPNKDEILVQECSCGAVISDQEEFDFHLEHWELSEPADRDE